MAIGTLRDYELAKFIDGLIISRNPDLEIPQFGLDTAGGQFEILPSQCALDIVYSETSRRKRDSIEPDTHRRTPAAEDRDLGHARYYGEPVEEIPLHVVG